MKSLLNLVAFYHGLLGSRLFALLAMATLAACMEVASVTFFMPLLSGVESDNAFNNAFRQVFARLGVGYSLQNILVVFLVLVTLRSVFLAAETAYRGRIMSQLLIELRQSLGRKIFKLDYLRYVSKSSGYLNNALVVESQNVVFAFKMLASLMVTAFFAAAYLSMPLVMNPILVMVPALVVVVLLPLLKVINTKTKRYSLLTSKHSAGLQRVLIQAFNNFKYLKATGAHKQVLEHVDAQSRRLGRQQYRDSVLEGLNQFGFEPLVALMIAGTIFYYIVLKGGNITEYIFLLFMLMTAMRKFLGMQQNLRKLLGSWGSIEVVRNLRDELDRFEEARPRDAAFDVDYFDKPIQFKDVTFRFNPSATVLKGINLIIRPNSTVAFVGESGGGKSTLVNLVIGLLEPTEGDIRLGDVSYRDLDKERFRPYIGYITQESVIFNDTIRNNVTLWKSPAAGEGNQGLEAVYSKARISDFVAAQPEGQEAMLGEGGVNISGGQRQRICIARELHKESRIMVFDEATSALDTRTEKEIQRNIDDFKGRKTVIIIAHRLSTVKNCDEIFVLKDGKIAESGSYEGLLRMNGEFKRMVDLQERAPEAVAG